MIITIIITFHFGMTGRKTNSYIIILPMQKSNTFMDDGWAVTILNDNDDEWGRRRRMKIMDAAGRGIRVLPACTNLSKMAFFKTAYSVCHLRNSPGDYHWYFYTCFYFSFFINISKIKTLTSSLPLITFRSNQFLQSHAASWNNWQLPCTMMAGPGCGGRFAG